MTSRGARNHKAKAKRARAAARSISPDSLPRPLRLIADAHAELAAHVARSSDGRSALARAEAQRDDALERLTAILADFDPSDVAELITVRNLSANPETYQETEHEGSLAIVEIVALAAAAMPGPPDTPGTARYVPTGVIDAAQAVATELVQAASLVALFRGTEDPSNPLGPLGFAAVTREITLRNTTYPHMLRDTLSGLFGTSVIEADLIAATGLTITEVMRFIDATDQVRSENWELRSAMIRAAEMSVASLGDMEAHQADRASLEAISRAALSNPADAGTITGADLAARTGLDEAKSTAFLDIFGLDCSVLDPSESVRDLLSGASPIRTRPIVIDGTGRASACHSVLMIEAVRPRLEEALREFGTGSTYFKHRGDYVEAEAVRLTSGVLPQAEVRAGFDYFVPNPDAPGQVDEATLGPNAFTKIVEGDGLLIVDDIAIVIESKAVNVSSGTRQGALGGIRRNLSRVVSGVVEQAHRMRTRIELDHGLRLRDNTWVDLSHIREIHSIAVTMEDLSGIATVTAHLVDARLIDPQALPWLVSLHDLRIITELVNRPAELLLFLRRRTHPDVTRKFWAADELDFYLQFQSTGLYVQPDPDMVAAALPHMPAPTTADRRRFAQQGIDFLTSRTGPLDDWYFYRLGFRTTPADKPSLVAPQSLLQLVDQITESGKAGWAATVVLMLECSSEGRLDLLNRVDTVVDLVRRDGRRHTHPSPLGHSAETLSVLTMASASAPFSAADREFLDKFTRAKKYQVRAARAATVVFGPEGEFLDLLYTNSPYRPDSELDQVVAELRLAPLVVSRPVPPRPRSRAQRRGSRNR